MDFSCTWKENKKNDSAQVTFKKNGKKEKNEIKQLIKYDSNLIMNLSKNLQLQL